MTDATGARRSAPVTANDATKRSAGASEPDSPSVTRAPSSPQPNAPTVRRRPVDEETIRQRAYELYAEGGFQEGNADADWFAAEREILADEAD
jgi:hypothetical protein